MTRTIETEFMEKAHALLQNETCHKKLPLWKGQMPGLFYPYDYPFECLIVLRRSNTKKVNLPVLEEVLLAVTVEDDVWVEIITENRTQTQYVSLRGPFDILAILKEEVSKLPN